MFAKRSGMTRISALPVWRLASTPWPAATTARPLGMGREPPALAAPPWAGARAPRVRYSTAMGISTTASGYASTAMGQETVASGITSTAMGVGTIASGPSSMAIGARSTASGGASFAGGLDTSASGEQAFAFGAEARAAGLGSVALGRSARTTATGSFMFADRSTSEPFQSNAAQRVRRPFRRRLLPLHQRPTCRTASPSPQAAARGRRSPTSTPRRTSATSTARTC